MVKSLRERKFLNGIDSLLKSLYDGYAEKIVAATRVKSATRTIHPHKEASMSVNKKYFFLRLKENYFEQDAIVLLESMPDGILYSNILLKLYLKSLKHDGKLQLDEGIPLTTPMLAALFRQQVGTIEHALKIFAELGLVERLDNGVLYMTNIELLVGHSSTEGERKRRARKALQRNPQALPEAGADICPPELERERERVRARARARVRARGREGARGAPARPRIFWQISQCFSFSC